ncbi:MAG TPA: hypothetical protein VFP68_10670 [Burkholderiaceae bacterium]|nr:hypothetical protein [Burkholderiaceae bacterium]
MSNMILMIGSGVTALAAAGTTLAWVRETRLMGRARLHIDQLQRQLGQANELLTQARRQTVALQQQLELARSDHKLPEQPTVLQLHTPRPVDDSIVVNGTGYADTLIQFPSEQRKAA